MTVSRFVLDPVSGFTVLRGPDNPATTGANAPIGSVYVNDTNGSWASKFGPADTDWAIFAATTGFLPLSGGSLNAGATLTVPGLLTANGGLSVTGAAGFSVTPTVGGVAVSLVGHTHAFSSLTGIPTSLSGYGILDAYTKTQSDANYPTKTGVGASGSWGISITGAAATAATVTGAAQAAITSVGTLLSLSVTGFITSANGYQLGGVSAHVVSGNYFILNDPNARNAILLGSTVDPTNYFDNTSHQFRSRASALYGTINASGWNGAVVGNVTGNVSGNLTGSVTGNATSARWLGIWDSAAYSGTGFTPGATRATNTAPTNYSRVIAWEFKDNGFFAGPGNYRGLLTLAPWDSTSTSTGDPSYQLLFSPAAANSTVAPTLSLRAGIDATWGAWSTLVHSANINSFGTSITAVGTLTGLAVSGSVIQTGNGVKYRFNNVGFANWDLGTIAGGTSWSISSDTTTDILTLATGGGGTLKGVFAATGGLVAGTFISNAANGAIVTVGNLASGSLLVGTQVATQGANGGSLNLLGSSDHGTPGLGVVISYYDGGQWRAAIDVRNASGFSTLNLMPTGGAVVTGADLRVGAQLFIAGQVAINNGGGAHGYTQFFEPDGNSAMHLGGTDDPGNYYSNTTHTFRTRGGAGVIAILTGAVAQFNVPIYSIGDGAAVNARASSNGGVIYMAFQTNTAARRGYVGFGLPSSSNFYINNDEAGPIILAPSAGNPVATFAGTAIAFGPRIDMGSYLNLNRANLPTGGSGIQFFTDTYSSWCQYMAPAGTAAQGPRGTLTAPTGSYVNSWAMRSLVEPVGGFGWTWESGAATGSYTPSIVMELASVSGNLRTIGTMYAQDFVSTSDRRQKQNIRPIEHALDRIEQLVGYTYELITDPTQRRAGLIAQDAQRVFKESVIEGPDGGLSLSAAANVALLTEGLKELRREVRALAVR